MTRTTHSAVGIALGLALALQDGRDPLTALGAAAVCAVAATLPDWDQRIGLKHRGISHSLIAWALVAALAWTFIPQVALSVTTGFGSHLLLDMLTVHGIPLFFPIQKRIRLARFTTGATMDGAIFVCAALTTIYLFGKL